MSPLTSNSEPLVTPQYRKPRADIYTMMLVLALLALLVGILCLWWENAQYEYKMSAAAVVPAALVDATWSSPSSFG